MAFQQGYRTRVLAGSLHLSCSIRNTNMAAKLAVPLDVTTLCDNGDKAWIYGGIGDATFNADGPLDVASSTNQPWDVMTAWAGTNVPITYMPSGDTALNEAFLMDGLQTDFTSSTTRDGTAEFSIAATTTGPAMAGNVLESLASKTTTGNGTSRDGGAASTNGAVFHLHVTTWATLTSNIVTVEDSSDGLAGWATIATFATATGVTSQRVQISGNVKRYLRVVDTITGSGSCTRAVAYARL